MQNGNTTRPGQVLRDVFNDISILARRNRHTASLKPTANDHQAKELIRLTQFPPDDILERDYMTQISHNANGINLTAKFMLSYPYPLMKSVSSIHPDWQRTKNNHMNFLTGRSMYINPVQGSPVEKNDFYPIFGFVCSNLMHDANAMVTEFRNMVQEQSGVLVDTADFSIQDREVETPTTFVPMAPPGRISNRSDYQPPRGVFKVLNVRKHKMDDYVKLVKPITFSKNREKYPNLYNMHLVDIRTNAHDSLEEWQKNVFSPQEEYYENRVNVIITGVPAAVDLLTFVPQVQFVNGGMNESTVAQLLTGAASLGTRGSDPIPSVFIKFYRGRDPGSWIAEGRTYYQNDIELLLRQFLKGHLVNWLHGTGNTSLIDIKYGPRRPPVFTGVAGRPITSISEDKSVSDEAPSMHREDFATSTPRPNSEHLNITGQHYGGRIASNTEVNGPNYSHYGPSNHEGGYQTDRSQLSDHTHRSRGNRRRHDRKLNFPQKKQSRKSKYRQIIYSQSQQLKDQNKRIQALEELVHDRKRKREESSSESDSDNTTSSGDETSDSDSDTDTSDNGSDKDMDSNRENHEDDNNGDQKPNGGSGQHDDSQGTDKDSTNQSSNNHQNQHTSNDKGNQDMEGSKHGQQHSNQSHRHNYDALMADEITGHSDTPRCPRTFSWPPVSDHNWWYSPKTDKLYRKRHAGLFCHDRNHHNYFHKPAVTRLHFPEDAYQVQVTVCKKVIKADIPSLADEEIEGRSIPINISNYTAEEVEEFEEDIAEVLAEEAYQKNMEEYWNDIRENVIDSLPASQREAARNSKSNTIRIEMPPPIEGPDNLQVLTCRMCNLVVANDPAAFIAHQNCCNGVQATNEYFVDHSAIKDYYSKNTNAISQQLSHKKYMAQHPCRLRSNHIGESTINLGHVLCDPKLYRLAGPEKYQSGEIIALEGDNVMTIGVVEEANHPNYLIDVKGNKVRINSEATSIFHAITYHTQAILNHQRYYQHPAKSRLSVGDCAVYNDGQEFLAICTVVEEDHPNYFVVDDRYGTNYRTTIDRLCLPVYCDFAYLVENEQDLHELHEFGLTVDKNREKWLGIPTVTALHQEIENDIGSKIDSTLDFALNSPTFQRKEAELDSLVRNINDSNYDDDNMVASAEEELKEINAKTPTVMNQIEAITPDTTQVTRHPSSKVNSHDDKSQTSNTTTSSVQSLLQPVMNNKIASHLERNKDITHIGKTPVKDNWEERSDISNKPRVEGDNSNINNSSDSDESSSESSTSSESDESLKAAKEKHAREVQKNKLRRVFSSDDSDDFSIHSSPADLDALIAASAATYSDIRERARERIKISKRIREEDKRESDEAKLSVAPASGKSTE